MTLTVNKHPSLYTSLLSLSREFVNLIDSIWKRDWSQYPPKIGVHFNYWDIKNLPSYNKTVNDLMNIPSIKEKYSDDSLRAPIISFLEILISSISKPSLVDKAFMYWWRHFLNFIDSNTVRIQLFIGLSNFCAEKTEYLLDPETKICFYGENSLSDVLGESLAVPLPDDFPFSCLPLHLIPGAVKVDFCLPANHSTLEYGQYSHECIKRMMIIKNALRLSTFGRLVIGPWIPICNPSFPIDGVRVIGAQEEGERWKEPKFHLDKASYLRLKNIYLQLMKLHTEDTADLDEGRAIRRRFASAISRFENTFDQGYWESVVVDLIIIMESLLTPNRKGGRLPLALAASNLLGINSEEAKEVFENITKMYSIRNNYVHGEPVTEDNWEDSILNIVKTINSTICNLDNGNREYAFEVMRDYARRSITASINLYFNAG
jgi:hypothetical protein